MNMINVLIYNHDDETLEQVIKLKNAISSEDVKCKIIPPIKYDKVYESLHSNVSDEVQLWRPWIIRETISKHEDGTTIIYIDEISKIKKPLELVDDLKMTYIQSDTCHDDLIKKIDDSLVPGGKLSTPSIFGFKLDPEIRAFIEEWYLLTTRYQDLELGSITCFSYLVHKMNIGTGNLLSDYLYVGHLRKYETKPDWYFGNVYLSDVDSEWTMGNWFIEPSSNSYDVIVCHEITGRELLARIIPLVNKLVPGGKIVFTNYMIFETPNEREYHNTVSNCKFAIDAFIMTHADLITETTITNNGEMIIKFKNPDIQYGYIEKKTA